MQLRDIYRLDIDRNINGVITVAQGDENIIEQELREYVITSELRNHFSTFFDNYNKSLTEPTNKIGVWISGFFGSGKSHFLKMLSYILSNRVVAGQKAVSYFSDKFDDPLQFSQIEYCANVPTETILFNIDAKSEESDNKETNRSIVKVFAKVFYDHCGFYGRDLKSVKFERFLTEAGKLDAFKSEFEKIYSNKWELSRHRFEFLEDEIVEAYAKATGKSKEAGHNWFNGTGNDSISIEQLVEDIKNYIDSKGKKFRLLFMVDEVGQYIGSDSRLMLNLQTIVEEIGSKCGGRVWVVVTSQEAIDSITKVCGNDFSKIQGRFNTRLSLSSSSVDEVIKKRILTKTDNAADMLALNYDKNSAVLKNLFTFSNAVSDLKGYSSEANFVETYPFASYQFTIMQHVLVQIRQHGNSGKHLSGGERSMLSGFQETAQHIENKDENALVPFYMFYDTVHTFLDGAIKRVIIRCQNAADNFDGIEQYDVDVLKLLYLIRYIDDIPANIENITTLMVDDMRANKGDMRKSIQASLDRLVSQNYVARNGDIYTFLTDDEQDIEREIRNTQVEMVAITKSIGNIIFQDIYSNKKFRRGQCDFPYDQIVDTTQIHGQNAGIRVRVLTVASGSANSSKLVLESAANHEAVFVISDKYPYFDDLEHAAKIAKYISTKNVDQLPENIRTIIGNKQKQALADKSAAREHIISAILAAEVYVDGETYEIKASSVKDKIDKALSILIDSVYSKLDLITRNFESDDELIKILTNTQLTLDGSTAVENIDAVKEVETFLKNNALTMNRKQTMFDIHKKFSGIPFGWREIDIAAVICSMLAAKKITISYCGSHIQPTDKRVPEYIRKAAMTGKTEVSLRVAIDPALLQKSRSFLKEYFDTMDVPSDEDALIEYVKKHFTHNLEESKKLLSDEYAGRSYPGLAIVENGVQLFQTLIAKEKDNTDLLTTMLEMQDDFFDLSEDMEDVKTFFENQRDIFDRAVSLVNKLSEETDYIQADTKLTEALAGIRSIIKLEKPYRNISELYDLIQSANDAYAGLLEQKKQEVYSEIKAATDELLKNEHKHKGQQDIIANAEQAFEIKRKRAHSAAGLVHLEAIKGQIAGDLKRYMQELQNFVPPEEQRPEIKVQTVQRSRICSSIRLENESDIDKYIADIKAKLIKMLEENDVLNII